MSYATRWLLAALVYYFQGHRLAYFHYILFNRLIPDLPNKGQPRGDWPPSCTRPDQLASENSTRSGLKVLVPGMSICGTTAVIDALKSVGVKAYHVEESMVYIAEILRDKQSVETIARSLSRCQVEAISLEPYLDSFPAMLEAAGPDVKVILNWRDYPSWSKSAGPGGAEMKEKRWNRISNACTNAWNFLPWVNAVEALTGMFSWVKRDGPIYDYKEWGSFWKPVLSFMVQKLQRRYDDPSNRLFNRGVYRMGHFEYWPLAVEPHRPLRETKFHEEVAFLNWHDEVRRLTPPGKLLEFEVKKHSYKELYEFLKDEIPELKEKVGQKLPKTRTKDSFSNDNLMIEYPTICICAMSLLFSVHFVNIFLVELTYVRLSLFLLGVVTCRGRTTKEKVS